MGKNERAIYKADTWHIDDGAGTDGGERYHKNVVRRAFTPEYKLRRASCPNRRPSCADESVTPSRCRRCLTSAVLT
jgi:hypothetical protein